MVKFQPEPKKHWGVVVDEFIFKHAAWAIPGILLIALYLWGLGETQSMARLAVCLPVAMVIVAVLAVALEGFKKAMNSLDKPEAWVLQHVERPGIEALRRLLNRIKKGRRRGIKPSGEDN